MEGKDYSQYKLNVRKSPPDVRDWKVGAIFPRVTLPEEVDYRPALFPIRDQGSSDQCAAFAGSAMKEWQERVELNIDEYMSPQFIYTNREDPNSAGMYMRDLMKILKEKGDCTEARFPFGTIGMPSVETYIHASMFKIQNFASVNSVEEAKTALFLNGPCIIAFPVYNYSERFWYQYSDQALLGGHAVCMVGYIKEGFLIRNSWGTDWGQNGYAIMPYEDFGWQWEIYSTIDAKSIDPTPPPIPIPTPDDGSDKPGCFNFW